MTDKLRECFDEMVVYKDLKKSNFFSALGLPSFLRDWLLKRFSDDEGNLDLDELTDFVHTYLPGKDEWVSIKNRIIVEHEHVKLLTRIAVDISIKDEKISFSLPDFGLTNKETIIESHVWDTYKVVGFKNFCPYTIDLDYYKDVRSEFSTSEWIDILLGAIDYSAAGYENEDQKLAMLTRLLPFVEKRLNLIELAPKGTGKSYVFGHVSKYGFLTDGGKVTRPKMFYDNARKTPGFIMGNDFVAIDEVKLVQFGDVNEMRSVLQGYMEYGQFNINGYEGKSDAGIVFLGNIAQDNWDEYQNMFSELPALFRESALVDRIHGFIKGWDIPRMNDSLKLSGWALNSEYFCTILHELRSDVSYRAMPDKADTRDTEAVKRICTAYLKLFFPNVRSARDINAKAFLKYCLRPANRMRSIIKKQLGILDKEFKGKDVPNYPLREIPDES